MCRGQEVKIYQKGMKVNIRIILNMKMIQCQKPVKMSICFFLVVDDGAVLDVHFEKFYHSPPDGFDPIMIEQSLL